MTGHPARRPVAARMGRRLTFGPLQPEENHEEAKGNTRAGGQGQQLGSAVDTDDPRDRFIDGGDDLLPVLLLLTVRR
jgi:hypothetical protein